MTKYNGKKFNIDVNNYKRLLIQCVFDSKGNFDFDPVDLVDELEDHGIFWYEDHIDGWSYLYDTVNDLVYHLDDHHFDAFAQLRETGETRLLPHENTYECYNGYEWNIEREREKEWNTIIGRWRGNDGRYSRIVI